LGQAEKYYPPLDGMDRRSGSQGGDDKTTHSFFSGDTRRKGKERLNTTTHQQVQKTIASDFPPQRIVERKIGRSTFIVSSRFNERKHKDIVSTVARLVRHDSERRVKDE
jgi:hypothetical protein